MNSSTRAFRLSPSAAARLSFVLGLGLTGAATLAAAPALYAQQDAARSDLAIQTDVVKAISSYPDLSSEHITATAKNGVVTLAGTASSSTAKSQAQVVAATVDGVQSVVNNVTVTGGAQNDPQADPQDQDVQQAQSTDPNQQQAPYSPQAQPKPGASGQWGQAGPPPDAENGQIPQQPQDNQPQGNPQQAGQQPEQYPGQEPGRNEGTPPPPQRPAYGGPNGQYPPQGQGYPPPPQQGYGQQGYGQQPYGGQNRGYAAPHLASAPLTIQPGTLFSVRTSEPLDSRRLKGGENFQVTLAQDIYQGQYLVVPRGAVLQGHVIGVKKPGALRGDAGFALQVTALTIGGQTYPVSTDTFATDTRGKGGYTAANTVGGAAIGALIGAAAGGGAGAGIGALIGGGAGLGASAASAGPRSIMPPETLLTFHLKAPLTVSPISLAEVQQLQASVTPRQVRRPRPPYPYGYPPPPPPPGYYYPYRY